MSDLPKQLRKLAPYLSCWEDGETGLPTRDDELLLAAANEIEVLRQRAEKAEVAIRLSDAEYWRQRAKKAEAALRLCVDALDAAHSDVRQSDAVQDALRQDEGEG